MAEPVGNGEGNFFQKLFGIKPKTETITPPPTPAAEIKLSPFAQQIADRNAQAKVGAQVDVIAPTVSGIDAAAANQAQIKQNFGNGAAQDGGAFGDTTDKGKIISAPKNPTLPGDA